MRMKRSKRQKKFPTQKNINSPRNKKIEFRLLNNAYSIKKIVITKMIKKLFSMTQIFTLCIVTKVQNTKFAYFWVKLYIMFSYHFTL
jgi:hypothetical protein